MINFRLESKSKCTIFAIILFFSVLLGTGITQKASGNSPENNNPALEDIISPDHDVQSSFDKIMSGDVESRKEVEARLGRDYIREHKEKQIKKKYFETLIQKVGGTVAFLRQVLYFIVDREGVKGMLLPVVYESLSIPVRKIFEVVVPYIDSKHSGLREKVKDFMRELSYDSENSTSDSGHFKRYLKSHPDKRETRVLVKYMYEFETSETVDTVLEVFGPDMTEQERKTVRALHLKIRKCLNRNKKLRDKRSSDDQQRLTVLNNKIENNHKAIIDYLMKLAEIEHWWIHLYVAERIRSYDELRNDRLIKSLMDDPVVKQSFGLETNDDMDQGAGAEAD